MPASSHSIPLETIPHRTASRPFSFHRTVLSDNEDCALYLHCHPEAELFYLEHGILDFRVENKDYLLHTGEGIFIPPYLLHTAKNLTPSGESCCYRAVVFSTDILEKNLPSYCNSYFLSLRYQRMDCVYAITREDAESEHLLSLLPSIFRFHTQELEQYELSFIGTLLLCWQELYNLWFSKLESVSPQNPLHRELQSSLDFIRDNFSAPLSLCEIAGSAGLSESYFCHGFKEFMGCTPFSYLNRIRITKSCELLAQSDKKITEIATLCGYNNISYFNRVFSKTMGITPSGYRKLFIR